VTIKNNEMILKGTNIQTELEKLRNKSFDENSWKLQIEAIFKKESDHENAIKKTLNTPNTQKNSNHFNLDHLATQNIYHIDQIKHICITYRLRFLDSTFFKSKIPDEAVYKIKALEKEHQTQLSGFKIIAPSKLFKLENADDPLLFALKALKIFWY